VQVLADEQRTEDQAAIVTAVASSAGGGRGDDRATVVVEERPPDAATVLRGLRASFPYWAFLHDARAGVWTALWGTASGGVTIVKRTPFALRLAVEEATRDRSR
jgi:hypothetical protein